MNMNYNKSMEFIQNLVEYYDELFSESESLKKFYLEFQNLYPAQVKLLQIGCGPGLFEYKLAKEGFDVTGLEVSKDFIDSANLKRRNQLLSIRFFKLSILEMEHFLGKNFYNVISCLNNRIVFIRDRTLMRKFFFDSRKLMSKGGALVLHLYNYDFVLKEAAGHAPVKRSMRAALYTDIVTDGQSRFLLRQRLETASGKTVPVMQDEQIYPLAKREIIEFGKEAGFHKFSFYGTFDKTAFDEAASPELICVLN